MSLRLPKPGWILLAAIVLIALAGLTALTVPYYRAHRFESEVEQLGGQVMLDSSVSESWQEWAGTHNAPWALGIFENQVWSADLSGTKIDDTWLRRLSCFPEIRHLDISGTEITDAGLAVLQQLPRLAHLDLSKTGACRFPVQ